MIHDDAPLSGPFHDWYETWRADQAGRARAALLDRDRRERGDRHIVRLMIAYAVVCGLGGMLAVVLVMAN